MPTTPEVGFPGAAVMTKAPELVPMTPGVWDRISADRTANRNLVHQEALLAQAYPGQREAVRLRRTRPSYRACTRSSAR